MRQKPFRVGERFTLLVNDGARTSEVSVEVQAREKIHSSLGTRAAYRVEPTVFGGLLKRKGRMLIWFSDDAERLPLRIQAMISVGTITANLKAVNPGTTSLPPANTKPANPPPPTPPAGPNE